MSEISQDDSTGFPNVRNPINAITTPFGLLKSESDYCSSLFGIINKLEVVPTAPPECPKAKLKLRGIIHGYLLVFITKYPSPALL